MGEDVAVAEQHGRAPEWIVVMPVKRLAGGKSRLSTRTAGERRDLALAFALDSVRAATGCDLVARVVVVTDDDEVRAAALGLDATWVSEGSRAELNAAIRHGVVQVRLGSPDAAVAVLAADLPALRSDELGKALALAAQQARAFVADAPGTGTTLLTALAGIDPDPHFGVRSRAAHAFSGAVALEPGSVPGLRRDVDTEVDLWDARRLGVGPATAHALR